MDERGTIYQLYKAEKLGEKTVLEVLEEAFEAGYFCATRWIPVSERLPEVGKKVPVCFMADGVSSDWHEAYLDHGVFIDGRGGTFPGATHWLPITLPNTSEVKDG